MSSPQQPSVAPSQTLKKRQTTSVVEDNSVANLFQGIDKNLIAIIAVAGVSISLSFYLFREVKKIREDIKTIKAQEVPDELQEKVDMNSNAINAVTTKLDQLINALNAQEQRRAQQMMQQQQQQQQRQQQQMPQQPQSPPPVVNQTESVQVPMMGGSVIPPNEPESAKGPTINIPTDEDYSDPGVIRI